MKKKYPYTSYLTADAIIYREAGEYHYEVLLVKRKNEPYKGMWALPGGYVDSQEIPLEAVYREVKEEVGLSIFDYKQFEAYSGPDRDPRGYSTTIVYSSFYKPGISEPVAGDDAEEIKWERIGASMNLAFDHAQIVSDFYLGVLPEKELVRFNKLIGIEPNNNYLVKIGGVVLIFPSDKYFFDYLNRYLKYPGDKDLAILELYLLDECTENFLSKNGEYYLFKELQEEFVEFIGVNNI